MTKYESVSAAVLLDSITELWGTFVSHCAIEGTSFACDGGGRGGGQFGALSPGFFGGGFFMLACCPRGAGVGWGLVSGTVAGAIGGGGACDLRGGGSFGLENWTVTCSFGWLDLLRGKVLLAVRKIAGGGMTALSARVQEVMHFWKRKSQTLNNWIISVVCTVNKRQI